MTPEDLELLERYCPELHYERREPYRADAADIVAVAASDDLPTGTPNRLLRAPNTPIASTIDEGVDTLTMSYLGSKYPDQTHALRTDLLDLGGPDFVRDAHARRAAGPFADKAHGRVIRRAGRTFLQYWLFYYYNNKTLLRLFGHEGDWEAVQVEVLDDGTIDLVYSHHGEAEARVVDLDELGWERPQVYVAAFSHACYFAPGKYPIKLPRWLKRLLPGDLVDEASESPSPVLPGVIPFEDFGWSSWPGVWGADRTRLPLGNSPTGPCRKTEWRDPVGYAEKAERPLAVGLAPEIAEPTLPPPAPPEEVEVARAADGFKISFSIAPDGSNPAAAVGVTLVIPGAPPATYAVDVTGPTGEAFVTYPIEDVDSVEVTTVGADGQMSDPVPVDAGQPEGIAEGEAEERLPPLRTLAS